MQKIDSIFKVKEEGYKFKKFCLLGSLQSTLLNWHDVYFGNAFAKGFAKFCQNTLWWYYE